VSDLPKPDLLHNMQLGMLDHHQEWIFYFMNTHEQLDKYNGIWLSVPAYHHLTPKKKPCEEVAQWIVKKMKEMRWDLLGVVTQTLHGEVPLSVPYSITQLSAHGQC
jgi:hypothetical protein